MASSLMNSLLVSRIHVYDIFILLEMWDELFMLCFNFLWPALSLLSPPNLPSSASAALALIALAQVNCCPACAAARY